MAPVNDAFANATVLTGSSGAGILVFAGSTREAGEPEDAFGDSIAGTVWFTYTPTDPGIFVFSTASIPDQSFGVEVWEGTTISDPDDPLQLVASNSANPVTVEAVIAANTKYYFRAHGEYTSEIPDVAYSWNFGVRIPELVMVLADNTLDQTPGSLRVSLTNGTADGVVNFTLNGIEGTQWTDAFDGTGVLTDIAVPILALDAGTYTLIATDVTSGRFGLGEFTIANDPLGRPTDLPADTLPVVVPQVGVQKWVIQDAAPGGATYTFPFNPAEMTSPHPVRNVTVETTTATDGQPLSFEAAPRPHQWEFSGFTSDQDFLDELVARVESNKRYFLVDHRRRAWVVTFEHLDVQHQIKPTLPWAHRYTMRCLILSGPEQLT